VLHDRLRYKVKGSVFGDSWPEAICEYSIATREFTCTCGNGKQQRVVECELVDVPNREGKKQFRFDIVSDRGQIQHIALAANTAEVKRRWLAAIKWDSRQFETL
jgi:hypothetical protein